ncbi:MAG: DsbA family protein [Hyphomicrobiales bacterium]
MDQNKRNTLLTVGAVVTGYAAFKIVPSLLPEKLELTALDRPKGFRKFVAGDVSSAAYDPFVGLSGGDDEEAIAAEARADARINADICGTLYSGLELGEGQVPMASFSDYYCPFCRVQTKRLAEMVKTEGDAVAVAWHELPLLGDTSDLAARAALAAKRQGAYVAFHERLMRSAFAATPEYLTDMSQSIGVDEALLIADMNSDDVSIELENSAALSRAFAFVGTPALVIGRTVVQGQVSEKMIERIIALEREEGWADQCA